MLLTKCEHKSFYHIKPLTNLKFIPANVQDTKRCNGIVKTHPSAQISFAKVRITPVACYPVP